MKVNGSKAKMWIPLLHIRDKESEGRGREGKGVMVTIFNIFKPFFNSILANPTHPNPSKDKVSSETNSITKRGAKKKEKI